MTTQDVSSYVHSHDFLGDGHQRNERKLWLVIALTTLMMLVEIAAGVIYGSMALLADGWHMSTHAGALLIAALAYLYARRHVEDRRFAFGTGKIGDLGGFASATILALISLLIGWESLTRLANPVEIDFGQAISVAGIGLLVNLVCAWLLRDDHAHSHGGHDHSHAHDHDEPREGARDNNLRAAYLHVLADALTSILAIVALVVGRSYGWVWADPAMGVVGALVIARWSWGLLTTTGTALTDFNPASDELSGEIRAALETDEDRITDLHVWRVGPGRHAAIVALVSEAPKSPADYKSRLGHVHELAHVTIEVQSARAF